MNNIPENLKYTQSHEWVEMNSDGTATIGITDHAQGLLGDMVFVELPEPGTGVNAGEDCAVVESVKAASDVYSPLSGEVIESNEALADNPEMVNDSPFGDAWLFKVQPNDMTELDELMDAAAYEEMISTDEADEE